MSGVAKSIKKVFKKVAKVVSVVAPIAVTAGALIFTAGSAMGISAFSGGWGGAVSKLISATGATGTLGNVLTSAVTQAGYGGVLGLVTGAVAGDPMKGMQFGAAAGAVTGGVTGALQPVAPTTPGTGQAQQGGLMTGPGPAGTAGNVAPGQPLPPLDPAAPSASVPTVQTASAPAGGGGALDFLNNNPGLVGGLMTGLGQALTAGADDEAAAEALLERDEAQRNWISANYRTSGAGLMQRGDTDAVQQAQAGNPTPGQKYVYDRVQNRVVLVPEGQA